MQGNSDREYSSRGLHNPQIFDYILLKKYPQQDLESWGYIQ